MNTNNTINYTGLVLSPQMKASTSFCLLTYDLAKYIGGQEIKACSLAILLVIIKILDLFLCLLVRVLRLLYHLLINIQKKNFLSFILNNINNNTNDMQVIQNIINNVTLTPNNVLTTVSIEDIYPMEYYQFTSMDLPLVYNIPGGWAETLSTTENSSIYPVIVNNSSSIVERHVEMCKRMLKKFHLIFFFFIKNYGESYGCKHNVIIMLIISSNLIGKPNSFLGKKKYYIKKGFIYCI